MALDELLLESASEIGGPILRFYELTEPAVTFGYFQKFAEIQRLTNLRPLIRRPTGGGLVPHDADWTYSLVFPPGAAWYHLKAIESYERVHQWLQAAFEALGVATELSAGAVSQATGQCFIGAERFDLTWQGRKIAGAAQRRTRQGLLVQGSIQPPAPLSKSNWQKALCEAASEQWTVQWQPLEWQPAFDERVRTLAEGKYGARQYNERR